ncbi:hypothetical protein CBOM_06612 [Ceraceosorus bombacis]|uniref:Uncharacterized protein n=1 Tax=Ceraceosorus bombacis TaxID=401625 RepID=A0A0P1BL45_9BASI|nr:hypothetical protein CBOM_06612 [Ceraceosorus bombacis]
MPALLINPRLRNLNPSANGANLGSSRYATAGARGKRSVGKRKTRRAENARLGGNPHIAAPRPSDYNLPHPNPLRPSHHPLPSSLNPHTINTSKSPTATASSSSRRRCRPDGPPDLGPDSRQISQAFEDAKAGTRDADETLIPLQEEEEGDEEWAADLDEGKDEEEEDLATDSNHSLSGSVASLGIVE